jgi:PIN domain nuclease of toxin-antitoxin system
MAGVVLDSSAILAVLNDEPGAQVVLPLLADAHASTLIVAEVVTKLVTWGMPIATATDVIEALELRLHDFSASQALAAAALCEEPSARALSLANRACIALAAELGVPAITADRLWAKIDLRVEVRLIR